MAAASRAHSGSGGRLDGSIPKESGASTTAEFQPDGEAAVVIGNRVYAVRGGRWSHRRGCLLIEGKSARALEAKEADELGLAPCLLCDPVVPAAT